MRSRGQHGQAPFVAGVLDAANAAWTRTCGYGFAAEYDVERKFRETRSLVAPVSNNLVLAYLGQKRPRHAPVVLMLLRSSMFVPGHQARMVQRALGLDEFTPSALDVAILDLEDGVPPAEKDRARAALATVLGRPSNGEGPARYVRINRGSAARDADLAPSCRGLEGIVATEGRPP